MKKSNWPKRIAPAFGIGLILVILFCTIFGTATVAASGYTNSVNQNSYLTDGSPPSVTTLAASEVTSNSARIWGNLNAMGSAASVTVSFEYGRSTIYGSVTTQQTMTTTGNFSTVITGLSSGSIYHFRAVADGGTYGIAYSLDMTFTTKVPPGVSTLAASYITSSTATLNGSLNTMGTASSINAYFIWGTSTSYGNTTSAVVMTSPGKFTVNISGLNPGTTYHFQAKADGGVNGISSGSDVAFFSTPNAPAVASQTPTSIAYTSVTMRGNLVYMGTATSVSAYFEYGTTTNYGSKTGAQTLTSTGPYSLNVGNLTPGTTYHYRAVINAGVNGVVTGDDEVFTTISGQSPQLGMVSVNSITFNSAVLVGNLESRGNATSLKIYFEYGTTTDYGSTITAPTPSGAGYYGGFSATVTGLQRGTTYHFRAVADGGAYGTVYSDDMTFITLGTGTKVVPTVSTGGVNSVTANSVTLNGDLVSLGSTSTAYVYFEYGTSTSYEGKTTAQLVKAAGTFSAGLSELNPGTLYHYRAVVDDRTQNIEYGTDKTFTTSTLPPTATTMAAENITYNSATLKGSLDSMGTATSVKVYFEYGTTPAYGQTIGLQTVTTPDTFTLDLPALTPDTKYYYRIQADGGINGIASGAGVTFTTLPQTVINVDSNSLLITPAEVASGKDVSVSATVSNPSPVAGKCNVSLTVNGSPESSQDVDVPAGSTQRVSFTVSRNTPGVYQIAVNGLTGSFTVTDNTSTTTKTGIAPVAPVNNSGGMTNQQLFVFISLIVIVAVVVAIFLIRYFEKRKL